MSFLGTLNTEAVSAFTRYIRSRAFWTLMVAGLAGCRFLVPRADGFSLTVSVDQHLPYLSATVIGISIGIALTTLLLPIQFLYLRSSTTRVQPWQLAEVTQASRIAMSMGRGVADTAVLLCLLSLLTIAGYLVSWLSLPSGSVHFLRTAWPIWTSGIPALMGVAALRTLFAAFPATRRAWGEVLFLFLWAMSLTLPIAQEGRHGRLGMHLLDYCGLIQPLRYFGITVHKIQIGFGMPVVPGRMLVDPWDILSSREYLFSRAAWIFMAVLLIVVAGWSYRPHNGQGQRALLAQHTPPEPRFWDAWWKRAATAQREIHVSSAVRLVLEQLRFMCYGRVYFALSFSIGILSIFTSFRRICVPAVILLLTFGVSEWAGVSEAATVAKLSSLTVTSATQRRFTFLLASSLWAFLLIIPTAVVHGTVNFVGVGLLLGAGVAVISLGISVLSQTAFAARLVLLLIWYGIISSN